MADQFENKHFDKRVAIRYVRRSVIDEKEYDKYLKTLPDLAEQALPIESAIDGELDAEDDDEG